MIDNKHNDKDYAPLKDAIDNLIGLISQRNNVHEDEFKSNFESKINEMIQFKDDELYILQFIKHSENQGNMKENTKKKRNSFLIN